MARLTNSEKAELYRQWLTGRYSLFQLADKFGITQATVSNIIGKKLKKEK